MDCLESLCDQTVENKCFEVIVVNDGGNTQLLRDLDSFGDRLNIRYFYQRNKGPAAARNLGIRNAKGDIVLFLDDDSLPTRNWLKAVITAWETFPNCDGIGGFTVSDVTDSMYCRVNSDFFNWYLREYSGDDLHPFLVTCNAGYRKSILSKIGYFDERFRNASGEDRDLNIRISRIGGKLRLDESILVYHDRDLTFRSFVRKHYYYGKAAYNIYAKYPELGRMSITAYVDLYTSTLKKYRCYKEKIMAFLLVTLSQLFTVFGYHSVTFPNQKQIT